MGYVHGKLMIVVLKTQKILHIDSINILLIKEPPLASNFDKLKEHIAPYYFSSHDVTSGAIKGHKLK